MAVSVVASEALPGLLLGPQGTSCIHSVRSSAIQTEEAAGKVLLAMVPGCARSLPEPSSCLGEE